MKEEYFRKNYPDSCYGDKPLSPHWDFFQDGVEFGERQSEKKIEELQEELKQEAEEYVCKRNPLVTKEWFIDAFKKYDKGEKVKYLKDCEIAEYEAYIAGAEPREKRIEELKEQNRKLLESCEGATMMYEHLTKAKEYIKLLLMDCVGVYESTRKTIAEIQAEAEQFISEVEK